MLFYNSTNVLDSIRQYVILVQPDGPSELQAE